MRTSMMDNKHLRKQLNSFEDHRPYFTYWTCTVQVLILLVALFTYGFGPVGFNLNRRSSLVRNIRSVDFLCPTRRSICFNICSQVLVTSLSLQQVDYYEPSNFWIGPRAVSSW